MHNYYIDRFPLQEEKSLFNLVENRTSYSFDKCELNVFETHQRAESVNLKFDHFVLTSMLRGKKVMRLPNRQSFTYLPGESVILPPGENMSIDFPEAMAENPTQCIALTISDDVIRKTIEMLNENMPKEPSWGDWQLEYDNFHLGNNLELADTINRIVRITQSEKGRMKDMMVDLTLKEMLLRLMQTQARVLFSASYHILSSHNALAAAIEYIKTNIREKIDLNKVAELACMSRASFFKKFKESVGETPSQFILRERIKLARNMLRESKNSITQVCFASGFENLSHFIKTFKNEEGLTPRQYQIAVMKASRGNLDADN